MIITLAKAYHGDCIWIRYGDEIPVNIIVDSGPASFSADFRGMVRKIVESDGKVDMLILTHIDDDHIKGFERYITDGNDCTVFEKVMFNAGISISNGMHSPYSAANLINELKAKSVTVVSPAYKGYQEQIGKGKLTLLTPVKAATELVLDLIERETGETLHSGGTSYEDLKTIIKNDIYKKDESRTNGASIAFVLTYKNRHFAFLGDAHCEDVTEGIQHFFNSCDMDLIKLSHHGSPHNITKQFLRTVGGDRFLLSTNKPIDKKTIARIVDTCEYSTVYCNYEWWESDGSVNKSYFTQSDRKNYLHRGALSLVGLGADCEKILDSQGDEICLLRTM